MRISTLQSFNLSLAQMQKGQTELARVQEQVSTGKQILRPSDDPVATARVLKLELELARHDKFGENIDATERRLQLEEITLDQINTATDRMRELALQAGNGTINDSNRATIAGELRQLQEHVLGMMNTQDSGGEYLFGGGKGFEQPFEKQGDNSFVYNGDDGQRLIQVGPQLKVATTDSGRSVFNVIPDDIAVKTLGATADTGAVTVSVTDPTTSDFREFADQYGDVTLSITNITAGPPDTYDYELLDSAGVSITGPTAATVGTPVEFGGLSIDYQGAVPAADLGPVTLRAEQGRHSILSTLEELATLLETPVTDKISQQALLDGVGKALSELDVAKEGNLKVRTQLGARMNVLESAGESNADVKLFNESALSSLQDLDYAEAITRFTLQETALQAAQATFSRVSQLSLFNYL